MSSDLLAAVNVLSESPHGSKLGKLLHKFSTRGAPKRAIHFSLCLPMRHILPYTRDTIWFTVGSCAIDRVRLAAPAFGAQ
jgi:hypothetical protein